MATHYLRAIVTAPDELTGEQVIQMMESALGHVIKINKAIIMVIYEPEDPAMIEFTDPWGNG